MCSTRTTWTLICGPHRNTCSLKNLRPCQLERRSSSWSTPCARRRYSIGQQNLARPSVIRRGACVCFDMKFAVLTRIHPAARILSRNTSFLQSRRRYALASFILEFVASMSTCFSVCSGRNRWSDLPPSSACILIHATERTTLNRNSCWVSCKAK